MTLVFIMSAEATIVATAASPTVLPAALVRRLYRLALWLWRNLPLGKSLRWLIVGRLRHKSVVGVVALIQDERGRVLLFHHTYRRLTPWGLPGGGLERLEPPEAAIQREVSEESGLQIAVRPGALVVRPRPGVLDIAYRCQIVGGTFRPSDEVDRMAYVPLGELPRLEECQDALIARARQEGYLADGEAAPAGRSTEREPARGEPS